MTTTKLFNTLKLVTLGIVLSIGLSYAAVISQQTWSPGAPTADNVDVPINATAGLQEKRGGLSVNTFAALGDAHLQQQAFIRGALKGIDPGSSDPTLDIGGTSSAGARERVVATSTGNWYSGKTIGSTTLINNNLTPLCSTTAGQVILCPTGGSTPPPEVRGPITIENNFDITTNPARITSITPSTWILFEPATNVFPIGPNLSRVGTHTAVSGFSLAANVPGPAYVLINRNGVPYKCVNTLGVGATSFTFSSPIAAADEITISLEPGSNCPITPGP